MKIFSRTKKEQPPHWTININAAAEIPLRIIDIDFQNKTVQLAASGEEIVARKHDTIYLTVPWHYERK